MCIKDPNYEGGERGEGPAGVLDEILIEEWKKERIREVKNREYEEKLNKSLERKCTLVEKISND